MTFVRTTRICIILLIAGMAFIGCSPANAAIQSYIGAVVPLSGYSYSGDYVYLFLTGPNLPSQGVALDNTNRVGTTEVQVDSDGHWEYKWGTSSSGKLDAGVYTVWVADGPGGTSQLGFVDYTTIGVDLTKPSISVNGPSQPVQPGSMDLNSTPLASSIVVNDVYRGVTPLTISGLDPGVYNVTFSKFGYAKLSTPVRVESGSISEVNAVLVLQTGSVAVNSSPAGARVSLDGTDAGVSPVTVRNVTPGNHTLLITSEGFPARTIAVQVIADQTTMTDITFASPQEPTAAPTRAAGLLPATVAGVLTMVLIVALNSRRAKK
jgi:hypothetical protein